MQVDHTFNGNAISGEASGSHQRLDFPSQLTDIASLPTGIAAVQYVKGGNLYSYNGSKQPVSGVSVTGLVSLTTSPQTLFTVPAECTGYVMFGGISGASGVLIGYFPFFSTGNQLYVVNGAFFPGTMRTQPVNAGVFTVQFFLTTGSTTNTPYKAIYWPI